MNVVPSLVSHTHRSVLLLFVQTNSNSTDLLQEKHLGSKSLPHLTVCAGISASLCVLRSVVPEKTHHQLS